MRAGFVVATLFFVALLVVLRPSSVMGLINQGCSPCLFLGVYSQVVFAIPTIAIGVGGSLLLCFSPRSFVFVVYLVGLFVLAPF